MLPTAPFCCAAVFLLVGAAAFERPSPDEPQPAAASAQSAAAASPNSRTGCVILMSSPPPWRSPERPDVTGSRGLRDEPTVRLVGSYRLSQCGSRPAQLPAVRVERS